MTSLRRRTRRRPRMARRGNSEGTITRRRDGRWETRITLPCGRRRSLLWQDPTRSRSKASTEPEGHLRGPSPSARTGDPGRLPGPLARRVCATGGESIHSGVLQLTREGAYRSGFGTHLADQTDGARYSGLLEPENGQWPLSAHLSVPPRGPTARIRSSRAMGLGAS